MGEGGVERKGRKELLKKYIKMTRTETTTTTRCFSSVIYIEVLDAIPVSEEKKRKKNKK